jgi:hypothetical protein
MKSARWIYPFGLLCISFLIASTGKGSAKKNHHHRRISESMRNPPLGNTPARKEHDMKHIVIVVMTIAHIVGE